MKNSGIIFGIAMMFLSTQVIGQKAISRSLNGTQAAEKVTKVDASEQVVEISKIKAEKAMFSTPEEASASKTIAETIFPPKSKIIAFHGAKKISNESDYFIQLSATSEPLSKENSIFQEFGNLKVRENINSNYCYLIGGFKSEKTATSFLNNIIIIRYPEAKVIELKDGERVTKEKL
jgi:hypothetical protein